MGTWVETEEVAWFEDTYEKIKLVSYWSFYKVDRLRYCRSIVLSTYYVTNKHQGTPIVVPDYQTPH